MNFRTKEANITNMLDVTYTNDSCLFIITHTKKKTTLITDNPLDGDTFMCYFILNATSSVTSVKRVRAAVRFWPLCV